jgi:protein SCO1/2
MSMDKNTTRLTLLAISLAVLAALSGALLWKMLEVRKQASIESLIVLPEPRVIADFALVDETSASFSLANFRNHWSLLFFGFTSCPDICPSTLYQLQQVRTALLAELDPEDMPQIYLVSVDPDRDSPQKLQEYLSYFDPAFKGITGPDEQLRALTMQLGIAYHVEEHQPGAREYEVDHSASMLLLDPQARLYGVFPAPHNSDSIIKDMLSTIH